MTWSPSWAYVLSSCFFEYSAWKNNCQTGFSVCCWMVMIFFFQCSLSRFEGVCMSSWDWIYKIHKVYCQMNIPQRFHTNITRNLSKSNWDSWTPILFERNLFKTFLVWIYPNVNVPAKGGIFSKSNAPNFAEFAYIIFKIKEYNGLYMQTHIFLQDL